MSDAHKLFPLGIQCCHCNRWHDLEEAIQHSKQNHSACPSCGIERLLAEALLEEAAESLVAVMDSSDRGDEQLVS